MLDRTQSPKIFSPIEFEYQLPNCEQTHFKNGIPLYFVKDTIEPVVQLEMVFKAGLWYEKKSAIAQATMALFKSGTKTKTSFQINETIEQYGASLRASAGTDWASITISCLSKHLSKLIPLLAELLTDSVFPQSEIDLYVQNAKQRLSVQLMKSDFVANRKIDEALFGLEHPYGRYLTDNDYDAINQEDLKNHLQTLFSSSNCVFFLAGHFGDTEMQAIERYLGTTTWNNTDVDLNRRFEVKPQIERTIRIQNDTNGVQGSIRLASDFPNKFHEDFVPMVILNTLFGGYFGSRLMSNIREEKGYTYGIHSYMYNHQQISAYLITTEAGKDVCGATIEEIYKEMAILRTELVDDEELDLVKNYLLGNILGDLDGAFQIIQRWKNIVLNSFDKERFNKNIEIYKTIDAHQLQALAQKYYQPEKFFELVVI